MIARMISPVKNKFSNGDGDLDSYEYYDMMRKLDPEACNFFFNHMSACCLCVHVEGCLCVSVRA
jgi:hypothetical protein